MALQTVAEKKHQPHDPLEPGDQEEVYAQLRTALAVALMINESPYTDDHAQHAAGAIVAALHKARLIMETGSQEEVRNG